MSKYREFLKLFGQNLYNGLFNIKKTVEENGYSSGLNWGVGWGSSIYGLANLAQGNPRVASDALVLGMASWIISRIRPNKYGINSDAFFANLLMGGAFTAAALIFSQGEQDPTAAEYFFRTYMLEGAISYVNSTLHFIESGIRYLRKR